MNPIGKKRMMYTKKWLIVLIILVLTFLVACEQGVQRGALAGKAGGTSKGWFRDG